MTRLDDWLRRATRHLSSKSAAQVRSEIQEHYELSRETALSEGAAAEEADRLAMAALGDARTANCQYRRVLLTSAEARLLRESIWEVRTVCARPWLKRALLATPVAALLAAILVFVASGGSQMFRMLLVMGIGAGLMFAAPFLPLYTPRRARTFRLMKWLVLMGAVVLALGPNPVAWSWLLISCLWPVAWI
ncbi:MAG: hypothetical protein ABI822_30155, partial [Bryobacteraceae bacterium]